jgi:drug/metabolite transporter (DMT)-like permease
MPYGNQDVVILACAVSAGIHAALAPDHFREATGAGLGFVVATVLLAALAVAVTFWPDHLHAPKLAALVFAGLIVSYGLAITTGVPVLHPDVEPVDGLALFTKAVEIAGLLASLSLLTSIERSSTWASQLLRARSLSH